MEEGSAKSCKETHKTASCIPQNVSEATVSSQPTHSSFGAVEDEDLKPPGIPRAADSKRRFEESSAISLSGLDSDSCNFPASAAGKVKGSDLFLSKACDDDRNVQSDSPLTSTLPGYSEYLSETHCPSQPFDRFRKVYGAPFSYSAGYSHFPLKRGRGRPRKDPFSPVTRRPRGRGLGRRGRPVLSSHPPHRASWPDPRQRHRSMDASDRGDPDDGLSMSRALGLNDGASTSGDQALAGSSSASVTDEMSESQGSGRTCAFCACGEKSLLGQGDLLKFEATIGFTPTKKVLKSRRGSSEAEEQCREKSPKHLTWRRPRGPFKGSRERSRSPRQQSFGEEETGTLSPTDELALVGFTDDVEINTVFDETGAVWAHDCCAIWSENVENTGNCLQYVDRAAFHGLSQKCGYCRRYGASLACRSPGCTKKYHFPCASAGNCFQDLKTVSLLCPDHVEQAEVIAGNDAYCIQCGELGNVSEQLFCTSCGQHYHGNCLRPSVEIKPIVRAGWQCPNCKICQTCRNPGDDIKMLVCDTCDKGYHTFCLRPAMTTIPKNGWKCKNCRICSDCGARTPGNGPSSRWHLNYSVCDSCYQQRNKGLCCPLCGKAYRHFQNKNMMVPCSSCKKHVHSECDPAIDSALLQRVRQGDNMDYVCKVCRQTNIPMDIETYALTAPSGTDESMESFPLTKADSELSLKDSTLLTEATLTTTSSQESLYCEDSNSSVDYDTDKTYVPHRDYMYGHKLLISRKKIGTSRTRSRGLGGSEKRHHGPLSLREKGRRPKMRVKMSPADPLTAGSTPTTPIISAPQVGEVLQPAVTPPPPEQTGVSSPSTPLSQDPNAAEKKEKDDDDDGDDHPATIILAQSKDRFVMDQDVCKSCGSFGLGDERKMIVCTQCGQCYHPFCVSVKVTRVILKKGWRCLDCTVCEGCGGRDDEGRLLLCDDCDISYHTYCLQPPLTQVPKGNWKCKWCVRCLYCGSTSPGTGCQWMSNYTKCGPCHSKQSCPVCSLHYREDELIIQCVHCDRWFHCKCDGLRNEDEAEAAADYGYHCHACRLKTGKHGPLPPPPPPPPPPPVEEEIKLASPPACIFMEPEQPRQYLIDGVYLLANGMQHIQSQIVPLPRIKRQRRQPKLPFGARTPRPFSMEGDDSFDKDDELKLFEGLEPGELPTGVMGSELTPEEEAKLAKIKRQRKQVGMGVGGFMIRQMTRKMTKRQTSVEEHGEESIGAGEGEASLLQEKPKKKTRKSRKGKLEESFPGYLQEAFFGLDLLNSSKFNTTSSQDMLHSGSDSDIGHHSPSRPSSPTSTPSTSTAVGTSTAGLGMEGEVKGVGEGVGDLASGSGEQRQATPLSTSQQGSESNELDEGDPDFLLEKDLLTLFGMDAELESGTDGSKDKSKEMSEKEGDQDNLDKILDSKNIDVDRMLKEGLVHFEGVDDLFPGVLKPEDEAQTQPVAGGEQVPFPLHPNVAGPSHSNMPPHPVPMPGVRVETQDHGMMPPPHRPGLGEQSTQEIPPFSIPPMFPPMSGQMSPDMAAGMSQTVPPWASGPSAEEEETTIGSNKRSILKWETDEALGPNATISAVLYVNINFPNLKKDYPEWSERSKQIAKLWRKLKPEEKTPYLAKARKNRTSHRVQKAQKQVSQELKIRREAQMIHDSAAMPPPPAPPPLPGQMPAVGDPFAQPPGPHDPPEALSPSMRNPLQSPGGPGASPYHRWSEDPFHKSPSMDTPPDAFSPPGAVPRQGAGAQTHEPFPFSPGTPKHDPFSMSPGTPRPRLQHQSFEQFVRGPGPQGASPVTSPLPPDDPYSKPPLTPRMFGAPHGPHARPKLDEHQGSSQPPDPYAFPPTTPRATTPQDDGFHASLRLPHPAPETFPGAAGGMQAGLGPRPGSESDLFHGLPPETFGTASASSSTHASPVHSMPSTPPRPTQYALSPGSGMTSPLRHPDSGPLLQRSNSLPHSYPGAPPRLPVDPAMSRSMSDVSPESLQHFPHRMPPPQDPALISRRLKLGPHGPHPWPFSVAPHSMGAGGPGTGEAALGSLGQGGGGAPTSHQQLREILGQQTKLRMKQKAAQQMGPGHPLHQQWLQQQQQETGMGAGTAGLPPSSIMPRLPGSVPVFRDGRPAQPGIQPERWPMVRPPHPTHYPQEGPEGFSPRGQPGEVGGMRFSVPQSMPQPQAPPATASMMSPGMSRPTGDAFQQTSQQGVASMLPAVGRPPEDEVFQQLEGQRSQLLTHSTTEGKEVAVEAGGSQDREEAVEGDALQLPVVKDLKPSISSEDDKPEDDDLLSADGTFDILKYADPELDLIDDPNLIDSFDLMDDPKASSGEGEEDKKDVVDEKSDEKKALESAVEGAVKADIDPDEGSEDSTKIKDFQAQFLEFSQRRQHQIDTGDGSTSTQTGDMEKGTETDDKAGVSHIAALLQGTKPISTRPGRGSIDGSVEGGKLAEAEATLVSGTIQSMLQRPPFAQGMPASLPGQTPMAQQSSPQSVQGPSGLPSPKVSHSPRSGQPSPRTPGIQSPYSQMVAGQHSASPHSQPLTPVGQMSPFSQPGSGQSPFSPTIPSAQSPFGVAAGTPASTPQSPYALQGPSRTISSFTMAVSGGQVASSQTGPLQHLPHPQPPPPQQMLASRATITPTNQYNQGSYSQPLGALGPPPRGATLTPTPSSILYGQSAATQHALRPQGPRPFPPGQELGGEGGEVGEQRLSHPSVQQSLMQQARFPGATPISLAAAGLRPPLPPTSAHPSLQHQLTQGQRPPFPPHRLLSPGLRPPGPPGVSGIRMSPASATEQKTLLDELLEQEKQEQKKQAEQQAMLHRPGQPPDTVMAAGPRPGMIPPQHSGLPPHGMPPRLGGPESGWAGGPRPGTSGELGPGQQFPPGFAPRIPGQPMGTHGPIPPFPPPQLQPPQSQAGPPMLPPPPPQVPVPAQELAPSAEYDRQVLQYEEWLSKQTQYLDLHVKMLEQQIQKQKRAKKSIQARQRQARKNNQELNPKDTLELERVAAEQSEIQKQLEAQRKQSRQHQVVVQDYYNKQKEQFGASWPAGMPAPPSGPLSSGPSSTVTAASTSSTVMLQPRVPGSPSSIRMSPTARQEYDAYMQSRLRMAAQSPRPRAPTTIQLGDNNPFSETFQAREQLIKKQQGPGMPPVSPSETTAASPGSQPAGTPAPTPGPAAGPPGPVPAVRPSLPATGEGMGPVQFFRERTRDPGARFIRPPGPYGDASPRVEGPRLPPYPGANHPGMHMESPRMPFPQGMPMPPGPGFGHPGMPLPPGGTGDMGVASTQAPAKEKKKRRKKKKVEDSDSAQSQPLPPSMPSQTMLSSSTQQTDSRPAPSGTSLPKPPEFSTIKPQSETDRRILEILSNTAALASKEGTQPPAKGGNSKGARSKSPAAATGTGHKSVAEKSLEAEQSSSDASGDGSKQTGLGPRLADSGSGQTGPPSNLQTPTASSAGVQTTTSIPGNLPGETGHPPPGLGYPTRPPHMPPSPHPGFPPQSGHHPVPGHPMLSVSGAPQRPPHAMPPASVTHPMGARPGMPPHPGHGLHLPPRGTFHPRLPPAMQQLQDPTRLPPHLMHRPPGVSVSMAQQHPGMIRPPPLPISVHSDRPAEGAAHAGGGGPAPPSAKVEDSATSHLLHSGPAVSQSPAAADALPSSSAASQTHLQPSVSEIPASSASVPAPSTSSSGAAEDSSVQQSTSKEVKQVTDSGQESAEKDGKVCDDGIHCGTDNEEENRPEKKVCDDGIHCGTDDEEEKPKKKVCDDGIHCGTDDEEEKPKKKVCDDGIHCGTDDEDDTPKNKVCDDGIHCGTDDEDEKPKKKVCDDGIHCGTDDEDEKPKKVCEDGIHCGTDDEEEKPKKKVCDDGIHCGTDDEEEKPKKKVCDDGIHCGTDDEEEKPKKKVCEDGIHCGTDDEEEKPKKKVCDDGIHCGTDDEDETPKKKVCNDGIHCGTDDEDEKPKKKVCDDGIHCGTDDEGEQSGHPKKKVCDDGIHCGTDDEEEKPKKKVCDDGIHCGTDDEEEKPKKKTCDDGIHCGTDDEEEKPKKKVCSDGIHCGTDDEEEAGKESAVSKSEDSGPGNVTTSQQTSVSATTTPSAPMETSVEPTCSTETVVAVSSKSSPGTSNSQTSSGEVPAHTQMTTPVPSVTEDQTQSVSAVDPPHHQASVSGGSEGRDSVAGVVVESSASCEPVTEVVPAVSTVAVTTCTLPFVPTTAAAPDHSTTVPVAATAVTPASETPAVSVSHTDEQRDAPMEVQPAVDDAAEAGIVPVGVKPNSSPPAELSTMNSDTPQVPSAEISHSSSHPSPISAASSPPPPPPQLPPFHPAVSSSPPLPSTRPKGDSASVQQSGTPTAQQGSDQDLAAVRDLQTHISAHSSEASLSQTPQTLHTATTGQQSSPVVTTAVTADSSPSVSTAAVSSGYPVADTTVAMDTGLATTSANVIAAPSVVETLSMVPEPSSESTVTSTGVSSAVSDVATSSVVPPAAGPVAQSPAVTGPPLTDPSHVSSPVHVRGPPLPTLPSPSGFPSDSAAVTVSSAAVTSISIQPVTGPPSAVSSASTVSPVEPSVAVSAAPIQTSETEQSTLPAVAAPVTAATTSDSALTTQHHTVTVSLSVTSQTESEKSSTVVSSPSGSTNLPSVTVSMLQISSAANTVSSVSTCVSHTPTVTAVKPSVSSAMSQTPGDAASLPSMTTASVPHSEGHATVSVTAASTSVTTSLPHSRPHLPPLSMGGPLHHPPDHPRAGQPRSPLDMLARVSHSALSSAGTSLPTSLPSTQPSPPTPGAQLSPDVMRGGFPRHGIPMSQHPVHHGMSTTPTSTSQHSPTMAQAGEGGYIPRHMFPGPGVPRFRGMAPPGEYPQGRGMMSPPAMSPTSPSQRGQRPQFPPFHGADIMHPGMPPRSMGPRPMLPPDVMSRTSPNADTHIGMMPPHMQGYGHPPPHSQAMMNRPPYNIHPPHSSGAVDFPPWPHHPSMSMAQFPGHRVPGSGPPSAPHSPSSTSPLRLQNVGPGFPKDPHMMMQESHHMSPGDPRMANLRMFAEQQRMGLIRQRHPMMPPGPGATAFAPHQHPPQPRHPMFPEEGLDPFHPLHNHPTSTPPSVSDAAHMAISQAMSPMGPGAPRPPFPEAVSLAPTSSLAPMMSNAGAAINSAAMETGVKGLDIVVNQSGLPGTMLVKQEPGVEPPDLGEGAARDMDMEQRAKHNALLKQLLSKEQSLRAEAQPPSTPDSEESLPQLTPEQQRQLELIDMMPLCKETEASTDLPDWDNKTVEEKEQLLELRKQEYEKKRKQYEAVRKKRKNQTASVGAEGGTVTQPKIKKRRTKPAAVPADPNSLATTDLSVGVPVSEPVTKKRGRRNKNRESRMEQRESELEFMAETFLQQLHSLPSVPLQEPDIALLYSIVPIKGAPTVTGVSTLRGAFGQGYLDTEFDVYRSLCFPPPPPSLQPTCSSVINTTGVFGEKETKHTPDIVTCVAASAPVVTTPVVSSPVATMPMPTVPTEAGLFALPAHPRIEVKTEPLRDTPDTIISSSSPECGFMEKEAEYSSLRPIDPASPGSTVDDKYSPTVPLLHPIPTYPKVEKDSKDIKPPVMSPVVQPPVAVPPASQPAITTPSQMVSTAASQSTQVSLSNKQEAGMVTHADMGTQAEVQTSQDLTVKLPAITSSLAQPFIDPSLDQKVSVTLTLSANASEDLGGVISAIADLLRIAVPPTYEITRTPSPEMFKMNMTHKEDVINIQALMHTKPTFCGHCHVVLINSGIRKHKSELPPPLVPDDMDPGEEEVTWCSMNCMNQFLQTGPQLEELEEELDEDNSNTSTIIMDQDQDQKGEKMDIDAELAKSQLSMSSSPKTNVPISEALSISTSSPALSASASATTQPGTPTTPTAGPSTFSSPAASPAHSLMSPGLRTGPLGSPHHAMLSPSLRGKEERPGKRHRRSSSTASQEGYVVKSTTKRWRDERWKRWDASMTLNKLPEVSTKELNENETVLKEELWEALNMTLHPTNLPPDQRVCAFCHRAGDGDPDGPSRLLNYDVDKWVHLNCALWSLEVYETCNGALMNVEVAFSRGLTTECVVCRRPGATVGCFKNRCTNNYHVHCAQTKGCFFFQDKTIICANHNNTPRPYPDAELQSLEVRRRVYINRDEEKQVASMVSSLIHPDEGHHALRIGSLILHRIGQLLPHQIQTNKFNTTDFIYPVGFRTTRFYWSHRSLYKRCRYLCSIADNQGAPEFIVCVKEEGHADVTFRDKSAKDVWMNMFRPLREMHSTADMVRMFPEFMCMEELFGLNEPAIVRVLESLPGADLLHNYNFKYGRSPLIEMPPAINPTGCARTEPKLRTHFRRPHTLHSSQSRSLPTSVTGVTGDMNSPYMKQFVHSKSQQYRRLKTEWKNLVYLGKSRIQGLGLYAARDLEKHTMVIEYIGDLIRNEVANRREKEYDDQNRGVYMFRIDNETVIDATMAGGPARYINHSCSPNCAAEVVPFEKESKIIIITSRRIQKGEELTYDYKFDFEDDQHKIPCLCGATCCRKWMN